MADPIINAQDSVSEDDLKEFTAELAKPDPTEPPAAPAAPAASPAPAAGGEDADQDHDDDLDEDEQEGSARVGDEDPALEHETPEQKAARRQNERKSRRQRQREKNQALEREVQDLRSRLDQTTGVVQNLQNFTSGTQMAQLDNAIKEAEEYEAHFDAVSADAITKGDGVLARDALKKSMIAGQRAANLKSFKENATRAAAAPKPADPVVHAKATKFVNDNKWYKGPDSTDPDSRIMATVDDGVASDGFDPKTDAYWQELESRAKKYLPHRFSEASGRTGAENNGSGKPPAERRPKSPVSGGSGNGNNQPKKGGYELSAARVQAIKDAGKWDDVAQRNKMIQSYRDYDAQHAEDKS